MKITRDELLIAAFKLFMSVNYEKASFAELGKMLGMSKAGIFKYYKNKRTVRFSEFVSWVLRAKTKLIHYGNE
jgi:AcrR family transcriptional regulator